MVFPHVAAASAPLLAEQVDPVARILETQSADERLMEATEAMVLTAIVLVYASECTMEETVAEEVPVVQLTYEQTAHRTYPSRLQQQSLLLLEAPVKQVRHTRGGWGSSLAQM